MSGSVCILCFEVRPRGGGPWRPNHPHDSSPLLLLLYSTSEKDSSSFLSAGCLRCACVTSPAATEYLKTVKELQKRELVKRCTFLLEGKYNKVHACGLVAP